MGIWEGKIPYCCQNTPFMDKFLNRICMIKDHSISKLDRSFANIYIQGLGSILFILTDGSKLGRMFYNVWAQSIMGDKEDYAALYWKEDHLAVKKSLSLKRKGWRLFTMKSDFIFDIYYLYEGAKGKDSDFQNIFDYLSKNYCGAFSKKTLKRIHNYFTNKISSPQKVGSSQISHKEHQEQYLSDRESKVLIVANVSAGKSTLINALVGYRISRTRTTVCTNRIIGIHNKHTIDGITIKTFNKEYSYNYEIEGVDVDSFLEAAFPFKSELNNISINLIDSPGVNNVTYSTHREITERIIKKGDYDTVIYVSNCQYFGTNDEKLLLTTLKRQVKSPIIFVLNQLDRFKSKEDSVKKMIGDYRDDLVRIGFEDPIICPVSSQAALLFKINDSFLDEEDLDMKGSLKRKFERNFFDLQSYITDQPTQDLLERTGIVELEKRIINTLNTTSKQK